MFNKNIKKISLLPIFMLLTGCSFAQFGSFSNPMFSSSSNNQSSSKEEQSSEIVTPPSTSSSEELPTDITLTDEPIHISLWTTMSSPYLKPIQDSIASFNALYPNITVEIVKQPMGGDDMGEKIKEGIAVTNEYPDIAFTYPQIIAEILDYGVVLDFFKYIEHPVYGFDQNTHDDFFTWVYNGGCYYGDPAMYSFPYGITSDVLYYNSALLNNLILPGVNYDNPINEAYMYELTWDKFFNELLPAVINKGGIINKNSINGKYTYFTNDSSYLIPEIAVTEGANFLGVNSSTRKGHLDFNNEGMKNVVKRLNTLYLQGYYDDTLTAGTYQNSLFRERETLFCVASSASYQYIRSGNDEIRALPLSLFGESYMQGFHAALLSHNDPQKALASWLFLKHITSEEVLIEFVKTSPYVATRYSVLAEYINNSYFNNMLEADIKINIPYSDLSFLPSFKGFNKVHQTLQNLYFECLTDTDLIHRIDNHFNKAYNECEKYI